LISGHVQTEEQKPPLHKTYFFKAV